MLSIGKIAAGDGRYYLDLAREDYYLNGGEPPGHWRGRGAKRLGLSGQVQRDELQSLLLGLDQSGKPLVQNPKSPRRQPGWDMTFSAPKGVSALWAAGDSAMRREIQRAHSIAIEAALNYLQEEAGFTRRGKLGRVHEPADLVFATFEHGTSRAQDPQLHTHCLLMNVGVRRDGTTGTILSKPVYQLKMAAGALYRAELAWQLEQLLGVVCEPARIGFRIRGVPEALIDEFSKRRKEIERELGSLGLESVAAAAFATLATRNPKSIIRPRKQLFDEWSRVARQHGLSTETARELCRWTSVRDRTRSLHHVMGRAVESLSAKQSYFFERDLVEQVAVMSVGQGLDATFLRGWVRRALQHGTEFMRLGARDGVERYTTREMFRVEESLLNRAGALFRSREAIDHRVVNAVVQSRQTPRSTIMEEARHHLKQIVRAAQRKRTQRIDRTRVKIDAGQALNDEQRAAILKMFEEQGRLKILTGVAGSGKTTTASALREIYQRQGKAIYGVTLAGKAARGLEQATGIRSFTLEALDRMLNPSPSWNVKQHSKQLLRAARGRPTFRPGPFTLGPDSVLLVDEAGMLGTRQVQRLVDLAQRGGGTLILMGDANQLPPIEAGGPLNALAKRLGSACLTRNERQRDPADARAVQDLREGNAEKAIRSYGERERLHVAASRSEAMDRLISDWQKCEGHHPQRGMIFASFNAEVADLNVRCQAARLRARQLDVRASATCQGCEFYRGDRVLITEGDRRLGVDNGDLGTITKVSTRFNTITVELDRGVSVSIPLSKFEQVRLGYAVTTHKGQGSTVDRAYVLLGGAMQGREISHVQSSRARDETRWYTDKAEAGEEMKELARQMNRSQAKQLAHDIMPNPLAWPQAHTLGR